MSTLGSRTEFHTRFVGTSRIEHTRDSSIGKNRCWLWRTFIEFDPFTDGIWDRCKFYRPFFSETIWTASSCIDDIWVIEGMDMHHRDWSSRITGRCIICTCDTSDGAKYIRRLTGKAIRHESTIRHTDRKIFFHTIISDELFGKCSHKFYIIDIFFYSITTTFSCIPGSKNTTFKRRGPVRKNGKKSFFVCFLDELIFLTHIFHSSSSTMKRHHRRSSSHSVIICRHIDHIHSLSPS